jgi:hypothetical protein
MKTCCRFVLLIPLLMTVGCVYTSHPVLKDEQVMVDKSLVGKWMPSDQETIFEIQPPGADKVFTLVAVDNDGKATTVHFRIGKVGDLIVGEALVSLDTSTTQPASHEPRYMPVIIRQTSTQLAVSQFKAHWLKNYLHDHPGALQVADNTGNDVVITAPTADFQAFLLQHWKDPSALTDPITYVHPGDPTTRQATTAP